MEYAERGSRYAKKRGEERIKCIFTKIHSKTIAFCGGTYYNKRIVGRRQRDIPFFSDYGPKKFILTVFPN